jgi:hypothetical protein
MVSRTKASDWTVSPSGLAKIAAILASFLLAGGFVRGEVTANRRDIDRNATALDALRTHMDDRFDRVQTRFDELRDLIELTHDRAGR